MALIGKKDVEDVRSSELFDAEWYLQQYPDVSILGMEPAEHYLRLGSRIGRSPSLHFDGDAYLDVYADVMNAGVNPLLHFVRWGRRENRSYFAAVPSDSISSPIEAHEPSLPRVIYESHNLKQQGAPNSLFEIASGIVRRRRYAPLLSCSGGGPLLKQYQSAGIEFELHGISQNRLKDSSRREHYLNRLAQRYAALRPSIIHVNTLQNFHCVLAARKAGIPVVWNIRESESPDSYYDYLPLDLRQAAYSAFDVVSTVVFVADATRELWKPRLAGKVNSVTIHNGLDMSRLKRFVYGTCRSAVRAKHGVGESDVLILSVGTVSERKGQQDLVAALKLLDSKARGGCILAMVGFGPSEYSQRVQRDLEELSNLGLRTILVDESTCESDRRRLAELYCAADIFVLNSRVESYPRVTLEAMSFGASIIATPCFGVVEQLSDRESCLFYEAADISGLLDRLQLLCGDRNLRRRLARAATDRLGQLNSYDQMLEAYESIYDRILSSPKLFKR
jgi:glycosyltransferase involved in cell wall biosynthesis